MAPRKAAATLEAPEEAPQAPTVETVAAPAPVAPAPAPAPVVPAPEPHRVGRQYFQKMQGGKQHLTWPGLLDLAHHYTTDDGQSNPVQSIDTQIIQFPSDANQSTCIVRAVVTMSNGTTFSGIGDANPGNVGKMVAPHLIRMAETRAKGRALRDAVNVGEAIEEEFSTGAPASTSSTFAPVAKNPVHERIDAVWASPDQEKKVKVRGYIMNNLTAEFGENAPKISSLADVKALPNEYLLKALEA